jgi:hypothetical protein
LSESTDSGVSGAARVRARLAALYQLEILDTPREKPFDDVVAVAAALCDTPIANINFVDADRQWGKALVGLESSEAPRAASFCAQTIQETDGAGRARHAQGPPLGGQSAVCRRAGTALLCGAAGVTDDD